MKFSMAVMVAAMAADGVSGRAFREAEWYGAKHGAIRSCGPRRAMTGGCTSGERKDCRGKTSHRIRCLSGENLFGGGTHTHPWMERDCGDWAICPRGSIAIERCAGGKNADCKVVSNKDYHHALRCKKLRAGWRVVEDNFRWLCGKWGVDLSCPRGYVVTESCGSGKNNDCDNRGCTGRKAWSGFKCNLLVDDSPAYFPATRPPVGTVSVRAARPTDNVQSPLGHPVCELIYHRTLGEEKIVLGSEFQVEEGFEVATTASSSRKLSVQQRWNFQFGVAKGSFSGTFGSETTFAGEWTTSSEVVRTSTMRTKMISTVQRTVTLPANTFVARARFVVLTTLTASQSGFAGRVAWGGWLESVSARYRHVSPAAYNLVLNLADHPNLIGISSCEAFVTELFKSGTINELNAGLHLL